MGHARTRDPSFDTFAEYEMDRHEDAPARAKGESMHAYEKGRLQELSRAIMHATGALAASADAIEARPLPSTEAEIIDALVEFANAQDAVKAWGDKHRDRTGEITKEAMEEFRPISARSENASAMLRRIGEAFRAQLAPAASEAA